MDNSFSLRVIAVVFTGMACIVGGDVAGKMLTQAGFPPFFVAWARFFVAAVVLLPFMGIAKDEWRRLLDWRLALRAGMIAGGICCIMTALRTEPIANVFAAFFVGPVVSFVLSAILLGERVTPVRAALLAVSFGGVLIVVRPGFGMTAGLGWALTAGCFYGAYLVATRWLAGTFRPRFLLWSQLLIGAVLLAPFTMSPLPPLGPANLSLLAISALASAAGNLLLVVASRTTPAGIIAPLIYFQLVAATVFGWLFFGDWPDRWVMVGLVVILTAGVGSALAAKQGR